MQLGAFDAPSSADAPSKSSSKSDFAKHEDSSSRFFFFYSLDYWSTCSIMFYQHSQCWIQADPCRPSETPLRSICKVFPAVGRVRETSSYFQFLDACLLCFFFIYILISSYFHYSEVSIIHGKFEDLPEFDCMVSAGNR